MKTVYIIVEGEWFGTKERRIFKVNVKIRRDIYTAVGYLISTLDYSYSFTKIYWYYDLPSTLLSEKVEDISTTGYYNIVDKEL